MLRGIAWQVRKEIRSDSKGQDQPPVDRGCTIEQFTRMSSSTFVGGADPIVPKDWVQETKELLVILHCTEEQWVQYATFKLVGEAKRWWRVVKLVEEQRSGSTYVTKFIELCHFASYMVLDESKKAQRFEKGLRQGIRAQVVAFLAQSFSKLVDRAITVEANI
ncbi:uncharacterized protein LOC131158752 [Malania oleifera]|uniref:uncharacterized protein LOC131158752 n=1 Tax=Malania oleifera TaxID=397392 RepID=UPI0025AE9647|nr:uncharacterized protein LOC131158752 [Malania oleifera]